MLFPKMLLLGLLSLVLYAEIGLATLDVFTSGYETRSINGNLRLPTHLSPEKYTLVLAPILEVGNFSLKGLAVIEISIKESKSKNITLHTKNLVVKESLVKVVESDEAGNPVNNPIESVTFDLSKDFMIIKMTQEFHSIGGKLVLTIPYVGKMEKFGIGVRSYVNPADGIQRYMALSTLSPTFARQAFPCFDEPAFKARFQIILGRRPEMVSFSMMEPILTGVTQDSQQEELKQLPDVKGRNFVWDIYPFTDLLSTYLVGLQVSQDYVICQNTESNALGQVMQLRVIAPKWNCHKTSFGHRAQLLSYEALANLLKVPLPLKKIDLIIIDEFPALGLENWAFTTIKSPVFYFEEGVLSEYNDFKTKETIVYVVAHELAHLWAGNLESIKWWKDTWLYQGFADYLSYPASEAVLPPDYRYSERFPIKTMHGYLERDALESTIPVSPQVETPSEIFSLLATYNYVTYKKANSLFRMMEHFIGRQRFYSGLTDFVDKFKLSNADQDDFWSVMEEKAVWLRLPGSVKDIMDSWTLQSGFPIVNATRSNNTLLLSQERFYSVAPMGQLATANWWIPISLAIPGHHSFSETSPRIWVKPSDSTPVALDLEVEMLCDCYDTPALLNVQQVGFYRVNYDAKTWKDIAQTLLVNHMAIDNMTRAQLLDDAFNIAKAQNGKYLDYESALDLTRYLANERDYNPLYVASYELTWIHSTMRAVQPEVLAMLTKYILSKLGPTHDRLGLTKPDISHFYEPALNAKLRYISARMMCRLGHKACISRATKMFWDADAPGAVNQIPKELRGTIYCAVVREGTSKEWNALQSWLEYVKDPTERANILTGLGCSRSLTILESYANATIDNSSFIDVTEVRSVFVGMATTFQGRDFFFNWLQTNLDLIVKYFGIGPGSKLGSVLYHVPASFSLRKDLDRVKVFFEANKHKLGPHGFALQAAMGVVEKRAVWHETYGEQVKNWLAKETACI